MLPKKTRYRAGGDVLNLRFGSGVKLTAESLVIAECAHAVGASGRNLHCNPELHVRDIGPRTEGVKLNSRFSVDAPKSHKRSLGGTGKRGSYIRQTRGSAGPWIFSTIAPIRQGTLDVDVDGGGRHVSASVMRKKESKERVGNIRGWQIW